MIAETDPTQREEALTAYWMGIGQSSVSVPETALTIRTTRLRGQLHTILEDMDRYPNTCLEELKSFMTLWDMCKDAKDRASNAQEEAQQKRKEALEKVVQRIYQSQFGISNVAEGDKVKFASSTLLDGALTWMNVYACSVTLIPAHASPGVNFKGLFIRKNCPRNEVKQMENELWNLKVKGTNLTAYNQRFQELILLCPEMVPNPDRLLERYIEGLPLNIKGNITSSKPVDLHEAIEMAQGLMYQTARVFTAGQGSYASKLPYCGKCGRHHTDVCPPTCHNYGRADKSQKTASPTHVPKAKEDPEAKEDREVMLLALDVVRRALQEQVSEQWKSRPWKSNSRQPTKSSEQSEAESRKS
ncbi:reverse transcriptase domain-containing protein [Tanacetum coccineum]